jgi:hypothetical protein
MEGRWTIHWDKHAQPIAAYKVGGTPPWPTEDPTPVVPCDAAAMERATRSYRSLVQSLER